MKKLYIVVMDTLSAISAGLMAAQACHAMRAFVTEYPEIERDWHDYHNNVVILQHGDLPSLSDQLAALGLSLSRFHEPDMDGALTAICVEPRGKSALRDLPLAG